MCDLVCCLNKYLNLLVCHQLDCPGYMILHVSRNCLCTTVVHFYWYAVHFDSHMVSYRVGILVSIPFNRSIQFMFSCINWHRYKRCYVYHNPHCYLLPSALFATLVFFFLLHVTTTIPFVLTKMLVYF
jgi:hypothetical protein